MEVAKSSHTEHLYLNKDHQNMRKLGPKCESPGQFTSLESVRKHEEVSKVSTRKLIRYTWDSSSPGNSETWSIRDRKSVEEKC